MFVWFMVMMFGLVFGYVLESGARVVDRIDKYRERSMIEGCGR